MANWDVTTANSALEFDTQDCYFNSCVKIDTNHFLNMWVGPSWQGYLQVFTVSTSTWATTTSGASFNFAVRENDYQDKNNLIKLDDTHIIGWWQGSGRDGFVQVFAINTSTWAVSTANASLEFDTVTGVYNSVAQIDTNHFINFWGAYNPFGKCQVFTVSTSTWAVTTAGAVLAFDTYAGGLYNIHNSCQKIDGNHFINFWAEPTAIEPDGRCQVFTVNTTTWAVTTANSVLTFSALGNKYNSSFKIDSNHFINFWVGSGDDGFVQVFTVNTSTWAVTTANDALEFDTQKNSFNSCCQVDSNHFINFWVGSGDDGFVQVFTVSTSTWAVTTSASSLEFDTQTGCYNSCCQVDSNHFINFWSDVDNDGKVQTFTVELGASGPANLKTLNTNAFANIKSINTNLIANVKTYNTQT